MDEYGPEIITVTDDDGVEHEFEVLDRIETDDDQKYVALIPYFEDPEELLQDDAELIILKAQEEDDGDTWLEPIEDDDEFDEIASIFEERLAQLYDFESDEETDEDSEE